MHSLVKQFFCNSSHACNWIFTLSSKVQESTGESLASIERQVLICIWMHNEIGSAMEEIGANAPTPILCLEISASQPRWDCLPWNWLIRGRADLSQFGSRAYLSFVKRSWFHSPAGCEQRSIFFLTAAGSHITTLRVTSLTRKPALWQQGIGPWWHH